jgi:hypothetical protein
MQTYGDVEVLCEYAGRLNGNFAELGVFRGGSALILCSLKRDNPLYLFDTFAGNPGGDEFDAESTLLGTYKGDLEEVKQLLKDYDKVYITQGIFPDVEIEERTYCFVHIDVDSHKATKAGLDYFYPRMDAGGVIIIHDIPLEPVTRAVHDFCVKHNITSRVIGSQGIVET